jgi:hypothetical protein
LSAMIRMRKSPFILLLNITPHSQTYLCSRWSRILLPPIRRNQDLSKIIHNASDTHELKNQFTDNITCPNIDVSLQLPTKKSTVSGWPQNNKSEELYTCYAIWSYFLTVSLVCTWMSIEWTSAAKLDLRRLPNDRGAESAQYVNRNQTHKLLEQKITHLHCSFKLSTLILESIMT